jgi:homoserine kinase type II
LKRRNAHSVEGWRKLVDDLRPRADEVRKGLSDELQRELDHLAQHWPKSLPAGVIHADLFPNNVFFLGDRLSGMIDFYFACNDLLAYDIAICLNCWCFESDMSFNATKALRLVAGYQSVRRLEPAEVAALPLLARGAAFRFLLTRLYDWLHTPKGALVNRLDPIEYLKKLRFHRSVKSAAQYGL